jgi:hypothetical protein
VRNDGDRPVAERVLELAEVRDCPRLNIADAVAGWRARHAAILVPALPLRVASQRVERLAGPAAEVDFVHLGRDAHDGIALRGDDACRMARAAARAGFDHEIRKGQ